MSDLISRQAAIDALHMHLMYRMGTDSNKKRLDEWINNLPPVQPKRMKGRWLPDNNFAYEMRFVCSVCNESEVVPTIGFTKYKPIWDFCPNCGADMRGETE
jgi:hypothetical protein